MTSMLIGLAWTYGTPFALYVLACLMRLAFLSVDDWKEDPSSDERWNAGLDYGMVQLCAVLGVNPKDVNWDAATETLDGDVCAAIGNIFRVKYGEDFDPTAPLSSQGASGELRQDGWQCAARKQALPEPADCNWPFCDCDPYASKVITAIEEAGFPLGARTPPESACAAY
jgi:hypothetical protein